MREDAVLIAKEHAIQSTADDLWEVGGPTADRYYLLMHAVAAGIARARGDEAAAERVINKARQIIGESNG